MFKEHQLFAVSGQERHLSCGPYEYHPGQVDESCWQIPDEFQTNRCRVIGLVEGRNDEAKMLSNTVTKFTITITCL